MLDTPGFDDTEKSDTEILAEIARILTAQYEIGVQLKGIIYLQRITDIRMNGSSMKTLQIFQRICGETALANVLLVTTRWNEIEESLGASRERELRDNFWAFMIAKGSKLGRFHGSRQSAISLASHLLVEESVVLELQRDLVDHGNLLSETGAGAFVHDDIEAIKAQHLEELEEVEHLRHQLTESDRAMKRQVQRSLAKEQELLQKIEQQQVSLHTRVGEEVKETLQQNSKPKNRMSSLDLGIGLFSSVVNLLGIFVNIPSMLPC